MRRTARTRPRSTPVIMTLSADVDVWIVFVRERVRCGQKEIIGRGQGLPKLVGVNEACHHVGPDVSLMWVMANDAGNADVGVIRQCRGNNIGGRAVDHCQTD